MTAARAAGYVAAQVIGGALGALVVFAMASGRPGYDRSVDGLGANGYGDASAGNYSLFSVALVEIVATAILVLVVLAVTGRNPVAAAGVPIGLTLAFVHLLAIGVDSTSVNPARSIGPALFAGGGAVTQLWVFIVFPLIGGLVGALGYMALHGSENAPKSAAEVS